MEVEKNCVVTISYHAREQDEQGMLVDYSGQDYPLRFLVGAGKMLPYFEEHLLGKRNGEIFAFQLPADFAYGKRDESLLKKMSAATLKENQEYTDDSLAVGEFIRLNDAEETQSGRIIERKKDSLLVDFNHPLAGKDLFFKGQIISVRKASFEEIERQHHIEPDGIRFQ
jgi:FKBP-type peptidyl-prolyl cis-trans isomerase SlyD